MSRVYLISNPKRKNFWYEYFKIKENKMKSSDFSIGEWIKKGVFTNRWGDRMSVLLDFEKDSGLRRTFVDGELEKVEEAKTEWRPKKDEMIEVSFDGSDFSTAKFKVYMAGIYWCECPLNKVEWWGWKFARPINKPKITITSTPTHDNHIFDYITEWINRSKNSSFSNQLMMKNKFNVGDIVKNISENSEYFGEYGRVVSIEYLRCPLRYSVQYKKMLNPDVNPMSIYLYKENQLEKVETFSFPTDKLSFRGKSKGIMLDENVVMYYSHKYKRILISEAEKKIPKDIVWVEVDKKDLKSGDVVCFAEYSNNRYIFVVFFSIKSINSCIFIFLSTKHKLNQLK